MKKFSLIIAMLLALGLSGTVQIQAQQDMASRIEAMRELTLGIPLSGNLPVRGEEWFRIKVTQNGNIVVSSSNSDTIIEAYFDLPNNNNKFDSSMGQSQARLNFRAFAGTMYLFKVTERLGRGGSFDITIMTPDMAEEQERQQQQAAQMQAQQNEASRIAAMRELTLGVQLSGNLPRGGEEWFRMKATQNGTLTVVTSGNLYTNIEVHYDSSRIPITGSGDGRSLRPEFYATTGMTYLIRVTANDMPIFGYVPYGSYGITVMTTAMAAEQDRQQQLADEARRQQQEQQLAEYWRQRELAEQQEEVRRQQELQEWEEARQQQYLAEQLAEQQRAEARRQQELVEQQRWEEANRYNPANFIIVPRNFLPATYRKADLFEAVAASERLGVSGMTPSGVDWGAPSISFVSEVVFVSQNGTDITFRTADNAIRRMMKVDSRTGLSSGQRVRIYYTAYRIQDWRVVAIEQL